VCTRRACQRVGARAVALPSVRGYGSPPSARPIADSGRRRHEPAFGGGSPRRQPLRSGATQGSHGPTHPMTIRSLMSGPSDRATRSAARSNARRRRPALPSHCRAALRSWRHRDSSAGEFGYGLLDRSGNPCAMLDQFRAGLARGAGRWAAPLNAVVRRSPAIRGRTAGASASARSARRSPRDPRSRARRTAPARGARAAARRFPTAVRHPRRA